MGFSFLNKKPWHTGSFGNIEKTWIAEERRREQEHKEIETRKKLKEERQTEEIKRMQVEAGLIPTSHLKRLDWIYQGTEQTNIVLTAEEHLLGKKVKEERPKKDKTLLFDEQQFSQKNEEFTKICEDPLYYIKKEEKEKKNEIKRNPLKMKKLFKQIESDILIRTNKEDSGKEVLKIVSYMKNVKKNDSPKVNNFLPDAYRRHEKEKQARKTWKGESAEDMQNRGDKLKEKYSNYREDKQDLRLHNDDFKSNRPKFMKEYDDRLTYRNFRK